MNSEDDLIQVPPTKSELKTAWKWICAATVAAALIFVLGYMQ